MHSAPSAHAESATTRAKTRRNEDYDILPTLKMLGVCQEEVSSNGNHRRMRHK